MGMLKVPAGHLQPRRGGAAFPVLAHTRVTSGVQPGSLARAVSTGELCSVQHVASSLPSSCLALSQPRLD